MFTVPGATLWIPAPFAPLARELPVSVLSVTVNAPEL